MSLTIRLSLLLILFLARLPVAAQDLYRGQSILLTVPDNTDGKQKKSALKASRVQVKVLNGEGSVFITPIGKLPPYIKSLEVELADSTNRQFRIKFNKKEIHNSLKAWQTIASRNANTRFRNFETKREMCCAECPHVLLVRQSLRFNQQ